MIHNTDIYQIEWSKFLFFKKIRIFLLGFILVLTGAFCMKIFTHAETISGVEIDGLKYDLDTENKTATVVGPASNFSDKFKDGDLVIPEKVSNGTINYDVKIIKESAFKDNEIVTSVTGASVEKIDDNAFQGCKKLAKVTFENAIYIGKSAFQTTGASESVSTSSVTSLTEVTLPKVKYIGQGAFLDCVKLTSVDLPKATCIGVQALSCCTQLQRINLPKVKVCLTSVFSGSEKLEELVLPELGYIGQLQRSKNYIYDDGKKILVNCSSLKLVDLSHLIYCDDLIASGSETFQPNFTLKVPKSLKSHIVSLTNIDKLNVEYYDDDKKQRIDGTISDSTELQAKIEEITKKLSEKHGGLSLTTSSSQKNYSASNMGKDAKYHVFEIHAQDYYEGAKNNFCYEYFRILESKVKPEIRNNIEYNGKEHNEEIKIKDGDNNLIEKTDYDLEYSGNLKDAGKKTVTIKFKSEDYSGRADETLEFEILPKNASNFGIEYEKEHTYDGKTWNPAVAIKDNDLNYDLVKGKDYEIIADEDIKEPGVKKIKINYIGNYTGSKNIELEIVVDKSDWGREVNNNGVINYVDDSGKTSAEVTGNEKIWLKEGSDNSVSWYAIDNSKGTFRKGSRFWVKWLGPKNDKAEFEKYYNQLDNEHKNQIKNSNLYIFLTGVTDPDGNEYTSNFGNIDYYIQIGDKWDKEKINAVFIKEGPDENFGEIPIEDIKSPEGTYKFAKITMNHFSPYSVYETNEEASPDSDSSNNNSADNNSNENKSKEDENNGSSNWNNSKNQSTQDGYQYSINSGLIIKISVLILILLVSASAIIILKKSKFQKTG